MENQIFTATVRWYFDGEEKHTFIVCQASSFANAVSKIEKDFGYDIIAIDNITAIGESETISFGEADNISQTIIDRLVENNSY